MKAGSARNRAVQLAWFFASVLAALGLAQCQDQAAGWQRQVRDQVAAHHLDVALVLVDERLNQNGADLEARAFLEARAAENKHELRAGMDASTFNYTGVAESQALALTSRWSRRLSSSVETDFSQRFGERATRFVAGVALHATRDDVVTAGGGLANANHIIPEHEAFFGYSHSFRISSRQVKGLELSYQQHWFWYEGVHVLTLGLTQLYYLPRSWTWSFSVTGARSGFAGSGVAWVPSGFSRLVFPIVSWLFGNVVFASGTENFAAVV